MKHLLAVVLWLGFVGAGYAIDRPHSGYIIVQANSPELELQAMRAMDHMNKWCLQTAKELWIWRKKTFENEQNPTLTEDDQNSLYGDGMWCNTSTNEGLRHFIQGLKLNYGKDMRHGPVKRQ